MKHIIGNLLLFLFSAAFFCCIYIGVFKMSAATLGILFVIFALYAFCMGFGWKSMEKIKKLEKKAIHFGLTHKDDSRILLYSLTALAPTYFCVILVSLVPLFTYEIWFITVFPCILLNCLPASSILEEYYTLTHKKLPFFTLFLLITIVCCLMGRVVSHWIVS